MFSSRSVPGYLVIVKVSWERGRHRLLQCSTVSQARLGNVTRFRIREEDLSTTLESRLAQGAVGREDDSPPHVKDVNKRMLLDTRRGGLACVTIRPEPAMPFLTSHILKRRSYQQASVAYTPPRCSSHSTMFSTTT